MRAIWHDFWHDTRGAMSSEYALIASFISIAIVVVLISMGPRVSALYARALPGLQ
jgi:Flp pilus assembly pilin Flp